MNLIDTLFFYVLVMLVTVIFLLVIVAVLVHKIGRLECQLMQLQENTIASFHLVSRKPVKK